MKLARRKVLRKIIEEALNLKLFPDFGKHWYCRTIVNCHTWAATIFELSGQWSEVKEWDEKSDPSSLYILLVTTFSGALATNLSSGSVSGSQSEQSIVMSGPMRGGGTMTTVNHTGWPADIWYVPAYFATDFVVNWSLLGTLLGIGQQLCAPTKNFAPWWSGHRQRKWLPIFARNKDHQLKDPFMSGIWHRWCFYILFSLFWPFNNRT